MAFEVFSTDFLQVHIIDLGDLRVQSRCVYIAMNLQAVLINKDICNAQVDWHLWLPLDV